jgi:hypothetical protein
MFNLINEISAQDRVKIENYINLYGINKDSFIGLDKWLSDWGKSNIKLYKLLGNQLIYKKEVAISINDDMLFQRIRELIAENNDFVNAYTKLCDKINEDFDLSYYDLVDLALHTGVLARNEVSNTIKLDKAKYPKKKKNLQIQRGCKISKAINTILDYFEEDYPELIKEIRAPFEKFRIDYSMIFNDKVIKGNLVISIHPLDYLTMSDNNSNWQSCMSWRADGCYHVGTVEMMNSNNVLCCYLESERPFYFNDKAGKENQTEDFKWNNKRWRQLVYITKDIIVGGKSYPYANEEITKTLLQTIKELAAKNLSWNYKFGPELYKDMIHINSLHSMNKIRSYIHNNDTKKHNIIFDTKGMYNDMLNDNNTNYWCYRNKVKKTKMISYSGKAPCLCCGKSVLSFTDEDEYNDRFSNTECVVCEDCRRKFKCRSCGESVLTDKLYTIYNEDGQEIKVCGMCYKNYIKKCPDCGEPFFLAPESPFGDGSIGKATYRDEKNEYFVHFRPIDKLSDEMKWFRFDRLSGSRKHWNIVDLKDDFQSLLEKDNANLDLDSDPFHQKISIFPVCACSKCMAKKKSMFNATKHFDVTPRCFESNWTYHWIEEVSNPEDWSKYMIFNLEDPDLVDNAIIKN